MLAGRNISATIASKKIAMIRRHVGWADFIKASIIEQMFAQMVILSADLISGERQMICPFCGAEKTRVIDTGEKCDGTVVQRRRQCVSCKKRFNTYERSSLGMPMVIKEDGSRQTFSRDKLARGISLDRKSVV